jgi:hypothetical protein
VPLKRAAAWGLGLTLFTHLHGHWLYLRRLDTDHTLLVPSTRPDPPSPPALTARVRVVVLDGLRDDVGENLPELQALGGARRIMRSEWPSYTYPNLAAMTTGVPPLLSGVRLNSGRTRVPLDTISDVALRHGRRVAVSGDWDLFAARVAPGAALSPVGDLEWIHFGKIDDAGHAHGAASPEYAEAAARGGRLVARLAGEMDLSRETLIVLADHGHRDRGGHGGREPEVTGAYFLAVGAGVRHGVRLPEAPMRDLAPTLARLLGLPPPRDNRGAVMADLFADVPLPPVEDLPYATGRWGRLAVMSLILTLLGLAFRRQLRFRARDFVPWVVYGVVFFAGYFALGYPLGWSIPRGYLRFFVETGLLGIGAGALAVWVGRRVRAQPATVLLLWGGYLLLAAAAGRDMARLEAPALAWAVVLGATLLLYLGGALCVSALIQR